MHVANYTQNLNDWSQFRNDGHGAYGVKRTKGTMRRRAYDRLLREARKQMEGWGIDFAQYGEPAVVFDDMLTATVTWKHIQTGQELELTAVWFDKDTGAIVQCGTNHGKLSL